MDDFASSIITHKPTCSHSVLKYLRTQMHTKPRTKIVNNFVDKKIRKMITTLKKCSTFAT